MSETTPQKAYCLKCDVLVHVPSGIAYTGSPEEDKFIGSSPANLVYPREKLGAMPENERGELMKSLRVVDIDGGHSPLIPISLLLLAERRENLEMTLTPDSLILTWKRNKATEIERIPYASIRQVALGEVSKYGRATTTSDRVSIAAAVGAGAIAAGPLGAATIASGFDTCYQTVKFETATREYEILVAEASEWVARLRRVSNP